MSNFEDECFRAPPESSREAFVDYFDGIILEDVKKVNEAAHALESFDVPFSRELFYQAKRYEFMHLEQSRDSEAWKAVVGWSLRAYVYSGTPVNRNLVLLTASRAEMDTKELKEWIHPLYAANTLFYTQQNQVNRSLPPDALREFDRLGLSAAKDIGVSTLKDEISLIIQRWLGS